MMDELRLTYDEESGCWTEYKEPFATVECQTEEDYNYLVTAVEFYKDRDKYVERKTGQWLPQILLGERAWDCSECKTLGSPQWKWCPVCGARMDGDEDG